MGRWRAGRAAPVAARRTGPPGEEPWWDPQDQRRAESSILRHRDLGKGWVSVPMVNNAERLDPHGRGPASERLREVRSARRLTALDEGAAWRRRADGALCVARIEVFSTAECDAHRRAWQDDGVAVLDAVWREGWRDRGRDPGWIEARWRRDVDRPDALRPGGPTAGPGAEVVDWLVVEDHTEADERMVVATYEHVTMWIDRFVATLTLRHGHSDDVDAAVVGAVTAAVARLRALGG